MRVALQCSQPHPRVGDVCWHHVAPSGSGGAAGASRIPSRAGWCREPLPGADKKRGGRPIPPPRAAAVPAVASFLQLMLFRAKLEASGSSGRRDEKKKQPCHPSRPRAPAAVSSPRRAPQRCAMPAPRRHAGPHARTRSRRTQPPRWGRWGRWHLCVCVPPSLPAPGALSCGPSGEALGVPRHPSCGAGDGPGGLPTVPGGRGSPGAGRAVPEGAGLTLRSAGNSSFFTSPVAAAMLPAPEKAASPSWDACSFAFSATARAGGSASVPPLPAQGGRREALGRIRPSPPACPGAGEGRGPGRRSAAGHGARAAPQILCYGPCYIRGFSRVTSAPSISP